MKVTNQDSSYVWSSDSNCGENYEEQGTEYDTNTNADSYDYGYEYEHETTPDEFDSSADVSPPNKRRRLHSMM